MGEEQAFTLKDKTNHQIRAAHCRLMVYNYSDNKSISASPHISNVKMHVKK